MKTNMTKPNPTPVASASRHTPEPWQVHQCPSLDQTHELLHILCAMRGTIAEVFAYGSTLDVETPKANAERIVACVNALAGMNPAAVKDAIQALQDIANHNGIDWDWATTGNVARSALAALKS